MTPGDAARDVVLFVKEGCHLCDAVEATMRSMQGDRTRLTIVDIDTDPALHDKYWLRIPVVAVGGKDIFEARMMDLEGRWKKTLASLLKS